MKKHLDLDRLFPHGLAGIIFDCDGVMIDSAAANRYLYNTILKEFGLPNLTPEQEKLAFQATFKQAIEALTPPGFHKELDNVTRRVIDYDKDILPKIKLMPGYRDFMYEALDRGLRLGVDTNRTEQGIMKVIKHFDLPRRFDPVISCSVATPKPSPEGVEMTLTAWSAQPDQVLYAGDSEDDKKAAKGAGVVFAAFNNLDLKGDLNISTWPQLAEILWPNQN